MRDNAKQRRLSAWPIKAIPSLHDCEVCRTPLRDYFVDGRRHGGSWATMCVQCFRHMGVGLGIDKGQLYKRIGANFEPMA